MTADVTSDLGRRLLECRTVSEVEETVGILEIARRLSPEERQDVTRVKAMLARKAR